MAKAKKPKAERAARIEVSGTDEGVGLREATVARAGETGLLGWVRRDEDAVRVHAEGDAAPIDQLARFLEGEAGSAEVETTDVKPEGHEQFAIRGVSAGAFSVRESGGRFEIGLEVGDTSRVWSLAKDPSMDPSQKRMAFEVKEAAEDPDATVWDCGTYEQGGRVPWPEAIERGHAVFVLRGEKLCGGFALQRIRPGARPGWLLIKRRDEYAVGGAAG